MSEGPKREVCCPPFWIFDQNTLFLQKNIIMSTVEMKNDLLRMIADTNDPLKLRLMLEWLGIARDDKHLADFILFIRTVTYRPEQLEHDLLQLDLSLLDGAEKRHLEEEFVDYKTLYPHE